MSFSRPQRAAEEQGNARPARPAILGGGQNVQIRWSTTGSNGTTTTRPTTTGSGGGQPQPMLERQYGTARRGGRLSLSRVPMVRGTHSVGNLNAVEPTRPPPADGYARGTIVTATGSSIPFIRYPLNFLGNGSGRGVAASSTTTAIVPEHGNGGGGTMGRMLNDLMVDRIRAAGNGGGGGYLTRARAADGRNGSSGRAPQQTTGALELSVSNSPPHSTVSVSITDSEEQRQTAIVIEASLRDTGTPPLWRSEAFRQGKRATVVRTRLEWVLAHPQLNNAPTCFIFEDNEFRVLYCGGGDGGVLEPESGENEVKCTICFDAISKAIKLSCNHSFCCECVYTLIEKHHRPISDGYNGNEDVTDCEIRIPCPLCRVDTVSQPCIHICESFKFVECKNNNVDENGVIIINEDTQALAAVVPMPHLSPISELNDDDGGATQNIAPSPRSNNNETTTDRREPEENDDRPTQRYSDYENEHQDDAQRIEGDETAAGDNDEEDGGDNNDEDDGDDEENDDDDDDDDENDEEYEEEDEVAEEDDSDDDNIVAPSQPPPPPPPPSSPLPRRYRATRPISITIENRPTPSPAAAAAAVSDRARSRSPIPSTRRQYQTTSDRDDRATAMSRQNREATDAAAATRARLVRQTSAYYALQIHLRNIFLDFSINTNQRTNNSRWFLNMLDLPIPNQLTSFFQIEVYIELVRRLADTTLINRRQGRARNFDMEYDEAFHTVRRRYEMQEAQYNIPQYVRPTPPLAAAAAAARLGSLSDSAADANSYEYEQIIN